MLFFIVGISIQFTLVDSYPDEVPLVEVTALKGINDEQAEEIEEQALKEVRKPFIKQHL